MSEETPAQIDEDFKSEYRALRAVLGRNPTAREEEDVAAKYKARHLALITARKLAASKAAAEDVRAEKTDKQS